MFFLLGGGIEGAHLSGKVGKTILRRDHPITALCLGMDGAGKWQNNCFQLSLLSNYYFHVSIHPIRWVRKPNFAQGLDFIRFALGKTTKTEERTRKTLDVQGLGLLLQQRMEDIMWHFTSVGILFF